MTNFASLKKWQKTPKQCSTLYRLFVILILFVPAYLKAQDSYQEKVTSACNIGLTIANNGLTGNCFKGNYLLDNAPSCQYPKGSGIEHLFEGGLWVGAMVNGQTLVTTGAVDD